jgi:hypothetical protein
MKRWREVWKASNSAGYNVGEESAGTGAQYSGSDHALERWDMNFWERFKFVHCFLDFCW